MHSSNTKKRPAEHQSGLESDNYLTRGMCDCHQGLAGGETDLAHVWHLLWGGRWIVLGGSFLFFILSVFYALSLPNIYKSEALLAPVEDSLSQGIGRMGGQLGGLASLAGVGFGASGNDNVTLAIEVLKSRQFVEKFVARHELTIPLMAANGWNRQEDRLILDGDIYDAEKQVWKIETGIPGVPFPTQQAIYQALVDRLNVTQDKKTGFVSISFEFYSPSLARQIVDWLVEDINEEIKEREVVEAKKSVGYLNEQLANTSIAEMRAVFYQLVEEQYKIIMFAKVRDEYVFKTIDRAIAAEVRESPRRSIIVLVITCLGGGMIAFTLIVVGLIKRPFQSDFNEKKSNLD